MFKLFFRVLGSFFSRWIDTDRLADAFPVSVKALIKDQDRYLLLQNERGEWDFPGGKLETGATFGQTLLEEVLEETNLKVDLENLCYLEQHNVNRSWVVVAVYLAKINSALAVQIPSACQPTNPLINRYCSTVFRQRHPGQYSYRLFPRVLFAQD